MKVEKENSSSSFFQKLFSLMFFLGFTNLFFFHSLGTTALALINVAFLLFIIFTFLNKKALKNQIVLIISAVLFSLFICLILVLRGSSFVKITLELSYIFFLGIFIYILAARLSFVRSLMELILAPFKAVLEFLKASIQVGKLVLSPRLQQKLFSGGLKRSSGRSLLLGVIITIPVLSLLIYFLSADPIFSHFLTQKAGSDFIKNMPFRLFLSLLLFATLSPFLFLTIKDKFYSPLRALDKFSFLREMAVIMLGVAAVMGLFLAVQWPYIFINVPFETDLSKFGVNTYSEYVQQGFGQLTQAAFFILSLLWLGLVVIRNNHPTTKAKKLLFFLQMIVLTEFAVFIVSLFRRIWLYQQAHGWSLARIYGGLLLVWILGITITLGLRHFFSKRLVRAEAIFTLVLLLFLGCFNAENFILQSSHLPTINKQIDYVYLSKMSADGYQGWPTSFNYAKSILENQNLADKDMLNKEDRRQIFYSGQIIYQLTQNYHRLIKVFGSQDEYRQYYQKTLRFLKDHNQKRIENLEQTFDPENKNKYELERLKNQQSLIEKGLAELGADQTDWLKVPLLSLSFYFNFQQFNHCPDPFFRQLIFNQNYKHSNLSSVDRFYQWNLSENKAYQQIKKNITIDQLLELQERYLKLHCKISSQPEDQQDFDQDFSFKNPLL